MKKIILLMGLLYLSVNTFSQKLETIIWGDSLFTLAASSLVNTNGSIVLSGITYFDGNNAHKGMVVDFGDFEEINHYFHPVLGNDTMTSYSSICQLYNGNYLCAGTQKKDNIDTVAPIFFTVLDSNLNFINEKTYFLPPQYPTGWKFTSIQESPDTILYAFAPRVPYIYGSIGYDLGFIRVSSTGDTIESRYYEYFSGPDNINCEVFDIQKKPGSDKYVVSVVIGSNDYQTIILNPDLSIDTIFTYDKPEPFYNIDGERDFGYWTSENTFITSGDGFMESKGDMSLFAAECDLEGNILGSVVLNTGVQDQAAFNRSIAAANDSTIYILGHDMCLGCDPVNDIAIVEVYTVDANLNVLGYNEITNDGYYKTANTMTNENGDLIVISAKNVGDTYHYNLYVTRIPREELGLVTSVQDIEDGPVMAKPYPNPATTKINFPLDPGFLSDGVRLNFYTFTGKTALSKPIKGFGNCIEVDINNLPKGVYIYEVIHKGQKISSGEFLKN
jgi:hypothetical protein